MPDKESGIPEDWFKKGDDDKQAVGILLEHGGKSGVAAFRFTTDDLFNQMALYRGFKKPCASAS